MERIFTFNLLYRASLCCFNRLLDFIQTTGALGGAASSLILVPAEVINSASLLSILSWFLSGLLSVSICQVVKQRMKTGQFASAPDAVHLIVTKEGFKGLYAGATLQILRFWLSTARFSFGHKLHNFCGEYHRRIHETRLWWCVKLILTTIIFFKTPNQPLVTMHVKVYFMNLVVYFKLSGFMDPFYRETCHFKMS